MHDPFTSTVRPLAREHLEAAQERLAGLVAASDDREAWRQWRSLEQVWDLLGPDHRRTLKDTARDALPEAPDGARRLAVVEKLPD